MPTVKQEAANGVVTPEEAARIRSSIEGREQAPSTRQQSFVNWRELANRLGQPFEVERIPISKLRQMRRDPMLGFGLAFIKTPIVRAKWICTARSPKGVNAQIAAHLDNDLRRIYASYILQWCNSMDFGFQGIAKRFELRTPSATYIETNPDTGEQEEKPVWSEGSVQPVAWKPFVALPPENIEPEWTGQGEFNGIRFAPATGALPGSIPAQQVGKGDKAEFKVDLAHSLWVTNERDQNFGSLYGYPRLGYAYPYWWSYWFRWAVSDRAFEKKGDPSILVRHPDEDIRHPITGEMVSAAEYGLDMGERLRSGGTLALPSDPYLGETDGKPSSIYRWDVEYPTDGLNFEPFNESFEYLDIQKIRALWIPEQAFLEGRGGTSSRNVAAETKSSFDEQQALLAEQVVESINRWVIPQWLAVNYPEFVAEGGSAEMVMKGFADQDIEFTRQIIQLVGQQESGQQEMLKLVDLKQILEDAGTPIASFAEQKRREAQIAEQAAASAPPLADPIAGVAPGVVPSATGFSYIAPREVIYLSDTGNDFLASLPATPHYSDRAVRGMAGQLWHLYHGLYADEYETAALAVEAIEDAIELSDLSERAKGLLASWQGSSRWPSVLGTSIDLFSKIADRATNIELSRARLSDVSVSGVDEWIKEHVANFAAKVSATTRKEVSEFLAARMADGVTEAKQLAQEIRSHFAAFPDWKADRAVRTVVRDVYNAATLYAAQSAGVVVQASDANKGETDPDCEERDGEIFTPEEAFRVDEHPNGTLGWRIIPSTQLSVRQVGDVGIASAVGRYDSKTQTILLAEGAPQEDKRQYLRLIADALISKREAA